MGHSVIEFRRRIIEINDSAINNLIRMMHAKYKILLEDSGANCPIDLRQHFRIWIDTCDNSGVGCIDLNLDELIRTEEQLKYFLGFLDEIEETVRSFGNSIPRNYLVQVTGEEFAGDLRGEIVLRDLKKFRSLLRGDLANGVIPVK